MTRTHRRLAALLLLASAAPAPAAKMPVPGAEAQKKAEKALKEAFKADYARTKPEDRTALAAKFLVPGREDRKDPAAWYVLLREARDLAVDAKRPRLAFEAIAEIDKHFSIDAVDMRLKALEAICKDATEVQAAAAFRAVQNLLQQAYYGEDFGAARRYLEAIEGPVRVARHQELLRQLRQQKYETAEYLRQYEEVTVARKKLAASPNDPTANYLAGHFACFFLGDWDKGLPLLAKGDHAGLKELASKELARPAEVKDQLAVADGWWNWTELLRDREQLIVTKHARFWYERAGPGAKGESRARVVERIAEAQRREYVRFKRLLPGSFLGRDPENRVLLLREGGGNLASEEAVERGLEWLAAHQSPSGAWLTDGFARAARCKCGEPGEKHDVAGTAFGLLPFLGAGQTHRRGKHARNVERGINWLLRQQKFPDGNFSDNAYENALAAIAVIEAYGLSRDRALLGPAQAAVNYIVLAQFEDGSWGYSKGTKGDLSVSGWQFTALKAAAYAGLRVPAETFARLERFLDYVADPGGLGYGYNAPGSGASTSAVGILCRQFLNWGPGHPNMVKAVENLLRAENYLDKDRNNMYAVFYIAQVAHHLGGEPWEKWNAKVRDVLIELQDKGTEPGKAHQKGSWSPRADAYAKQGGRVMYTALSLITLQGYYYHIPLYGYGPYVLLD